MKKFSWVFLVLLCLVSCQAQNKGPFPHAAKFAKSITAQELKPLLYTLASDSLQGRKTGTIGQKKAARFIKDFYQRNGIKSPLGDTAYFQEIPAEFLGFSPNGSENVVAMIKGSEFPDQIVVISAHYDHLGIGPDGRIYHGADDDASGTSAVMAIAKAFKKAADAGHRPRRTILILHMTGEEEGLYGSRYYTQNPIFPLKNTVTDLNIDMIGRIDKFHKDQSNYIYLIGSNRLSSALDSIVNRQNRRHTILALDYKYNAPNEPHRFYYRSDHYNFAKHRIPVIFFFNGVHADYHQPTDTPDKIDYPLLAKRARLVFYTAWAVANRDKRLKVDKAD